MIRFALRTVQRRWTTYLAAGAVLLAGTTLLTAFALLVETGRTPAGRGYETLIILPAILGGWTVLIVTFGVVSTIALTVQHRERELALLRAIAASAGQVHAVTVVEILAISVPMIALGIVPGIGLGGFVLSRLRATGFVPDGLGAHAGGLTIGAGAGLSLLTALLAAVVTGRRAGSVPPVRALGDATLTRGPALGRVRRLAGSACTGLGLALGGSTFAMPNGPYLSSTAGPAGVALAVGLALLSPAMFPAVGRLASRLPGSSFRLAGRAVQVQPGRAASVVTPLVLLIGIATGTLYQQSTEDSITQGTTSGAARLASVNYLVVGMLVTFCAILVLNTLLAATRRRRQEFGLLRLTAATRGQVLRMVVAESLLTGGLATVLGTITAAVMVAPYSMVRTGSLMPSGPPAIYLSVVAGAFVLAFLATLPTTARTLWTPPVETLAG
jgi:putative ABC transport system permease protein